LRSTEAEGLGLAAEVGGPAGRRVDGKAVDEVARGLLLALLAGEAVRADGVVGAGVERDALQVGFLELLAVLVLGRKQEDPVAWDHRRAGDREEARVSSLVRDDDAGLADVLLHETSRPAQIGAVVVIIREVRRHRELAGRHRLSIGGGGLEAGSETMMGAGSTRSKFSSRSMLSMRPSCGCCFSRRTTQIL